MEMDKKEALRILKICRPSDSRLLSNALSDKYTAAMATIEESIVQKPPHNSNYAAAIAVWNEYINDEKRGFSDFREWCNRRLNADKQHWL